MTSATPFVRVASITPFIVTVDAVDLDSQAAAPCFPHRAMNILPEAVCFLIRKNSFPSRVDYTPLLGPPNKLILLKRAPWSFSGSTVPVNLVDELVSSTFLHL